MTIECVPCATTSTRHATPEPTPMGSDLAARGKPALPRSRCEIKDLRFYYKQVRGAERHQPDAATTGASPRSSARRAAASRPCCASSTASTSSIPTSAPPARCWSTARTSLDPGSDLNLLRAKIGMVFQKPTPFPMSIYDNVAFGIRLYERLPSPSSTSASSRRCAAPRCGTRSRTSCGRAAFASRAASSSVCASPAPSRCKPRNPAARRAGLGARPDLDPAHRGADRRAEDPTIASSSSRTTCSRRRAAPTTPPSCISASSSSSTRPRRIFTHPREKQTEDYITGRFG